MVNLKVMAECIRAIEFSGRFPASLARVVGIYLELGERPGANVEALEWCIRAAVGNCRELQDRGVDCGT